MRGPDPERDPVVPDIEGVERRPRLIAASIAAAVAGTAGAVVLWATAPFGAGITPDSVNYLTAARSLADGIGYRGSYGGVLVDFPPGFPMLLAALLRLTGWSGPTVGRVANVVLCAVAVWLTFLLGRRILRSAWLPLAPALVVAASPVVTGVAIRVWSEPMFIVLVLASLLALHRLTSPAPSSGRRRLDAPLLGMLLAGTVLTRYVGVPLVVACTGVVLVMPTWRPPRTRLLQATVVAGLPALALAAWVVVLRAASGVWLRNSHVSKSFDIGAPLSGAASTLRGWVAPVGGPDGQRVLAGVAVLVAVPLVIAACRRLMSSTRADAGAIPVVLAMVAFVPLYIAFAAVGNALNTSGELDTRMLAPCFAPLALVATWGFEGLLARRDSQRRRLASGLWVTVAVALALIVGASIIADVRQERSARAHGVHGATSAAFRRLPIAETCRDARPFRVVLSNFPESLSFWCKRPFNYGPIRGQAGSGGLVADSARLRGDIAAKRAAYLVWLDYVDDPTIYRPEELARSFSIRTLRSEPGVRTYELTLP